MYNAAKVHAFSEIPKENVEKSTGWAPSDYARAIIGGAPTLSIHMKIYQARRGYVIAFLLISLGVVGLFLYISNDIVRDLSAQERERMQIWADATREIVSSRPGADIEFPLSIVQANTSIPVVLTDEHGRVIDHRNLDLPDDDASPYDDHLNGPQVLRKLRELKSDSRVIDIEVTEGLTQHLYYGESRTLRLLNYFPYVQLGVMIVFVLVVYYAVSSSKKAEQNKVWVGLSKETAHQLGTPISSLMAWIELLPTYGVDGDVTEEMNKDVKRLAAVASRFSKIGSRPSLVAEDANILVERTAAYMSTRVSPRVSIRTDVAPVPLAAAMSEPLMEWVLENLIKNAVDAMEGEGRIDLTTSDITVKGRRYVRIDVTDTGKGMSRRDFKTVFQPGYTTKSRGWGLGLTLARRIVEEYHGGRIFVASSVAGEGTTFSILLPYCMK